MCVRAAAKMQTSITMPGTPPITHPGAPIRNRVTKKSALKVKVIPAQFEAPITLILTFLTGAIPLSRSGQPGPNLLSKGEIRLPVLPLQNGQHIHAGSHRKFSPSKGLQGHPHRSGRSSTHPGWGRIPRIMSHFPHSLGRGYRSGIDQPLITRSV
jgi:hypothetical protein